MENELLITLAAHVIDNYASAIEVFLVMALWVAVKPTKSKVKIAIALLLPLASTAIDVLVIRLKDGTDICTLVLALVAVMLCFEEKIWILFIKYLFSASVIETVYVGVNIIVSKWPISDHLFGGVSVGTYIKSAFIDLVIVLIYFLFCNKKGYRQWVNKIKTVYFIIAFLCFFALSGIITMMDTEYLGVNSKKLIDLLELILTFTICVLCAILMSVDRKRIEYKNECLLRDETIRLGHEYYKNIENNINEARHIRHDINAHYSALERLIDEKNLDEAKAYLQKINENSNNLLRRVVYTHNELVDAIIDSIVSKYPDIIVKCSGSLENSGVNNYDLCTVFSNLVKNAVEADLKLEKTEKYISIEVKHYEGWTVIEIDNPVEWPVDVKRLGSYTTKNDTTVHGIGITNVRETVKKYSGELKFTVENNIFKAKVQIGGDKNGFDMVK